jgi:hypothetical protein
MQSPFRDDEEAARNALEPLAGEYERLKMAAARAADEIARLRMQEWIWALRVAVLLMALVASYFVGYSSTGEAPRCGDF